MSLFSLFDDICHFRALIEAKLCQLHVKTKELFLLKCQKFRITGKTFNKTFKLDSTHPPIFSLHSLSIVVKRK